MSLTTASRALNEPEDSNLARAGYEIVLDLTGAKARLLPRGLKTRAADPGDVTRVRLIMSLSGL